jgi:hypothetical protein
MTSSPMGASPTGGSAAEMLVRGQLTRSQQRGSACPKRARASACPKRARASGSAKPAERFLERPLSPRRWETSVRPALDGS